MKKHLYSFIYYRLLGWKSSVTATLADKEVICIAPHTSNWDFLMGKIFWGALGQKSKFLMKKEWFFFPLGLFFRAVGGIPVDRSHKTSLVDQLAEMFSSTTHLRIGITPEGTRKPNPEWKKGFYYIALNAGVPILLAGIDYGRKTIYVDKTIIPTGNVEQDMAEIKDYFRNMQGKNPANFAL